MRVFFVCSLFKWHFYDFVPNIIDWRMVTIKKLFDN